MDAVHPGGLGGTYGGNPVACAAALGAIETMKAEDLPARARAVEAIVLPRLLALAEKYGLSRRRTRPRGDARRRARQRPGRQDPGRRAHRRGEQGLPRRRACHADLLARTATCFRFLPPLSIPDELLTEGLDILEEAFAEVLG